MRTKYGIPAKMLQGLTLLLLIFGSCGEIEPIEVTYAEPEQTPYLSIMGAGLRESSAASGIVTRADAAAPEEIILEDVADAIGVFLQADPDKGYKEAIFNKKYTYGTPVWMSDPHLMLEEISAQLAAYYPYDADCGNPKQVLLTSARYEAGKEFYYLPFKASRMSSSLHLQLRRAYSLVRFNLFAGEEDTDAGKGAYKGDGEVTAFGVTAPLISTGMLNLYTGTVSPLNTGIALSVNETFTAGTQAAPYALDFLIVPTDLSALADDASKVSFTLTVDGKQMQGSLSAATFFGADKKLLEGVKYEANVVIRPTGLEVATLQVKDWEVVTGDADQPLENI